MREGRDAVLEPEEVRWVREPGVHTGKGLGGTHRADLQLGIWPPGESKGREVLSVEHTVSH